ncbi:MAG: VOC family protein [Bacillus sp. (in: firmicutes)]
MAAITHIGLAVPDLEYAIHWYEKVLGFQVIAGPYSFDASKENPDNMTNDLLGSDIRKMRNAHLMGCNQVGIELFEFVEPQTEEAQHKIYSSGFFHICLIADNVEEKAQQILHNGGKIRSKVWNTWEGKPYYLVYCEDPFGNIIELYSKSTELMYGNKDK